MSADDKKKTSKTKKTEGKAATGKKVQPKKPKKSTVSKDKLLIEKLSTELKDIEDRHVRLKAEFDNFRRRKERDYLKALEYGGEDILLSLLPVLDDFDRLTDAFDKHDKDSLEAISNGLKLIRGKIDKILKEKSVVSFGEPGDMLDAELHDAMMVQNDPEKEDNEILAVYEKGYRFKDRVLRHARVIVNKK